MAAKKAEPTVKVEATAKVSASAKFHRTKNITEVVPEDVTRAKAGAWLTLISPITEWAGMRGGQLRHKRELLRIQQEETLYRIAKKAAETLDKLPATTVPVPTKFLVPFLEKASLEEPDSELIELWANLLVSAGTNYNPHYIHFANIISQLSAQQAKLFVGLIGHTGSYSVELAMDSLQVEFVPNFMEEYIRRRWGKLRKQPKSAYAALKKAWSFLNMVCVEIVHVELWRTKNRKDGEGAAPPTSNYDDKLQIDYDILSAVGLIRYIDTGEIVLDEVWSVKLMFYHLTPLGRKFAEACGILKDDAPEHVKKVRARYRN